MYILPPFSITIELPVLFLFFPLARFHFLSLIPVTPRQTVPTMMTRQKQWRCFLLGLVCFSPVPSRSGVT